VTEPKILAIIPAYNESGNIYRTIEEIKKIAPALDIVVVNDGSRDTTAREAKKAGGRVISLPFNLGIGGAVQTGFKFAEKHQYDFAVQIDGDGQHDPRYLDAILKPVLANEADIVVGSRFRQPFLGYQSSFVRRIGIHFFAHLISFLTGYHITDPTSGFRAFNRKAIKAFAASYPQDFPEPESIVAGNRWGLRILEAPVEMRKRVAGQSSIRYLRTLYYMIKVTFAILLNMLKQRKVLD
jgi:glycosyltransferase involved in cell wall biosynthesis